MRHTLDTHTLADGKRIALTRTDDGKYAVQVGLTDRYVSNVRTGEPVQVTTHGCVYCDIYEEHAREVYAQMCRCTDIDSADKVGTRYWDIHLDALINARVGYKSARVR